ncbi:MAG: hypothetical protein JOY51_06120 [Nevskia sp.]|nr:hypothetical protein [Nevskia sp.]
MGVTEQQLRELSHYETSDAFAAGEKAALDLAVAMAKTPADISPELRAKLRTYFDEAQLVELAASAAWENYRARFNRAFDVQPSGFSEGAFCALPAHQ